MLSKVQNRQEETSLRQILAEEKPSPSLSLCAYHPEIDSCRRKWHAHGHYPQLASCIHVCMLSCVQLFATPRTVAAKVLCPWDFSGEHTGVGCHFLLEGMFPTQGLNQNLLASPPGKPP